MSGKGAVDDRVAGSELSRSIQRGRGVDGLPDLRVRTESESPRPSSSAGREDSRWRPCVDSLLLDPVVEVDLVEADELADLQIGDSSLSGDSSDEPWADVEVLRSAVDVEELVSHGVLPVRVVGWFRLAGDGGLDSPFDGDGRRSTRRQRDRSDGIELQPVAALTAVSGIAQGALTVELLLPVGGSSKSVPDI